MNSPETGLQAETETKQETIVKKTADKKARLQVKLARPLKP